MQTYGNIKEYSDKELDAIIDRETELEYIRRLQELSNVETYSENYYSIKQVKDDAQDGNYTFISRNSILKDIICKIKGK